MQSRIMTDKMVLHDIM